MCFFRARDTAEQKYKDLVKGYELLQNKLRQGQSERVRICNVLDGKCSELVESQKQLEKLKEDHFVKESKLKWTQNKLKSEMDVLKETQTKLDNAMVMVYCSSNDAMMMLKFVHILQAKITELTEVCEQVRRESQESIRKFQTSEENKAVTLDHKLKEQQARLILERHVTEDKEMLRVQLQKEVETLKHSQEVLIEENTSLSLKVEDLEKLTSTLESTLNELKTVADQRGKDVADLTAKAAELETMKIEFKQ